MKNKKKQQGFFNWIFKKWYFWILVVGLGFYAGVNDGFMGLLGSLVGSFLTFAFLFWIVYLIKKAVKKG